MLRTSLFLAGVTVLLGQTAFAQIVPYQTLPNTNSTGVGLSIPKGVCVDSNGSVFVVDSQYGVVKFDSAGHVKATFGESFNGGDYLLGAIGIAVDLQTNNIFVADTDHDRVVEFDDNGNFLNVWGPQPNNYPYIPTPTAVAVDKNENLYVNSAYNTQIEEFDKNGNLLTTFYAPSGPETGPANIVGLATDSAGNLYAVDGTNNRIDVYTAGNFTAPSSTIPIPPLGTVTGPLPFFLRSVGVTASGNIFVTDPANSAVQEITSAGALIQRYPAANISHNPFSTPVGLCVSGSIVYVSDSARDQIFELLNGPLLSGINPKSIFTGSPDTPIALTGRNFVASSTATIGGNPLAVTYVNSGELTATVPAATLATGAYLPITVTNPVADDSSSTARLTVLNPKPTIWQEFGTTVPVGSSDAYMGVIGPYFAPGSQVVFGPLQIPLVSWQDPNVQDVLFAIVPAADLTIPGSFSLAVQTPVPAQTPFVSAGKFTITAPIPTLSSVSPASASLGDPDTVITCTGANFYPQSVVSFQGKKLATTLIDVNHVQATIPAADLTRGGTFSITVNTAVSGSGTSDSVPFVVNNPTPSLSSVTPTTAVELSTGVSLAVTGSNFVKGSSVRFGGHSLTTTFVSAGEVDAVVPPSYLTVPANLTTGQYDVTVYNPAPAGGSSNASTFTVTMGQIGASDLTIVTSPHVSASRGNLTVTVTIKNTSVYAARGVVIAAENATLAGVASTSAATAPRTINANGSTSYSFTFPQSQVPSGTDTLSLTYSVLNGTGGTITSPCTVL